MDKSVASVIGFAWMAAACLLSGCGSVAGNGVVRQVDYSGTAVNELKIDGPWTVNVACNAPVNACVIRAEDNLWPYVNVEYGDEMKVSVSAAVAPTAPMTIEIQTTAGIAEIGLEGIPDVVISDNHVNEMKVEVSDSARLLLQTVNANDATFKVEDSGSIRVLDGVFNKLDVEYEDFGRLIADRTSVGKLDADIRGASDLSFDEVGYASVIITGNGGLRINNLKVELTGEISGNSRIYYGGSGVLGKFRSSGASSVRKL